MDNPAATTRFANMVAASAARSATVDASAVELGSSAHAAAAAPAPHHGLDACAARNSASAAAAEEASGTVGVSAHKAAPLLAAPQSNAVAPPTDNAVGVAQNADGSLIEATSCHAGARTARLAAQRHHLHPALAQPTFAAAGLWRRAVGTADGVIEPAEAESCTVESEGSRSLV